jgi:hypothetical protein
VAPTISAAKAQNSRQKIIGSGEAKVLRQRAAWRASR